MTTETTSWITRLVAGAELDQAKLNLEKTEEGRLAAEKELEEVRAGYARLSMKVTQNMTNAQEMCHGGMIFTLADSSFGFASNSRNQRALAASCTIEYLAPAQFNDALEATVAVTAARGSVLELAQSVRRDGQALVTATVRIVCVNTSTFRPVRIPQPILEKLAAEFA